jgi:hypothetical protein
MPSREPMHDTADKEIAAAKAAYPQKFNIDIFIFSVFYVYNLTLTKSGKAASA